MGIFCILSQNNLYLQTFYANVLIAREYFLKTLNKRNRII